MLWKLIKSNYESSTFDEPLFEKEYRKLAETFLQKHPLLVDIIVPLDNFNYGGGVVDLSECGQPHEKIQLRKITSEERSLMMSVLGGYANTGIMTITKSTVLCEFQFFQKFFREGVDYFELIRSHVTQFVSALRLLKAGYVGSGMAFFHTPLTDKSLTLIPFDTDIISLISANEYDFQVEDTEKLIDTWKLLQNINNASIETAVRRFNLSYEKRYNDDKFIDMMISYESLFSKEGERTDSISYKLALRSLRLLYAKPEDRKTKFKHMKDDIYAKRSNAVHGGSQKVTISDLSDIEGLMRDSINRYLIVMDNKPFAGHNEFIEFLDFS